MADLYKLKFYLLEEKCPYFEEFELEALLIEYGDAKTAAYQGCLIKAQDDSISLGSIQTTSNESFWLRRAKQFRPNHTGNRKRADSL